MEISNNQQPDDRAEVASAESTAILGSRGTEEQQRKRKLLIALPIIIVPCLILAFWTIRSGGGASPDDHSLDVVHNVNTNLPNPILDKPRSKRGTYELADKEADQRQYNLLQDPYAEQLMERDSVTAVSDFQAQLNERTDRISSRLSAFTDQMADVEQKGIGLTSASVSGPKPPGASDNRSSASRPARLAGPRLSNMTTEEDRKIADLEAKMSQLSQYGSAPAVSPFGDPFENEPVSKEDSIAASQLQTLDGILSKATMLRYPELAEEELRKQSLASGEKAFPISQASVSDREVRYFGPEFTTDSLPHQRSGFYTDTPDHDAFQQITVGAKVHSSVTVVEGSTVKLRLLDDVFVAGLRIPRHSFVHATTSLSGDRLRLEVESLNYRGNIYRVNLSGYDLDGLPGIAVPGSVERQIAKREASRSARTAGSGTTRTNNLASQLAIEGSDAVREIASRKLSTTKIHLKANYQIILRNEG